LGNHLLILGTSKLYRHFFFLGIIEAEAVSEHPKKGLLRTAIAGIKAIKGPVEFVAAVATLVQFVGQIL